MPSAAAAMAALDYDEMTAAAAASPPAAERSSTAAFKKAAFFKSSAAAIRKSAVSAVKRAERPVMPPRAHTTSSAQLPLYLASYVSFCAYSSQWDPSIYGAGNPCPPPPRGTLNDSKLAFLDWRMAVIKFERENEPAAAAAAEADHHPDAMGSIALQALVQDGVPAEGLHHETALRAGVQELQVPDDYLVRHRKPVQRVSAFPPRPRTTEGLTTYVPKIPGRPHRETELVSELQEAPYIVQDMTTTAAAAAAPTGMAEAHTADSSVQVMNAVVLPMECEESADSSGASTPSRSSTASASESGSGGMGTHSIVGSCFGSDWAATSYPAAGRHRATSSAGTTAFESSERRPQVVGHRGGSYSLSSKPPAMLHPEPVSVPLPVPEPVLDLTDLERTAHHQLVDSKLALAPSSQTRTMVLSPPMYNQNKPLPPPGVGPNDFFLPPAFEPAWSHAATTATALPPVREASYSTPQRTERPRIRHTASSQSQSQFQIPSQQDGNRVTVEEQQEEEETSPPPRDRAPSRLSLLPRRSKSLLGRAVSLMRPSTASGAVSASVDDERPAAVHEHSDSTANADTASIKTAPGARLSFWSRGLSSSSSASTSSRKRSRSRSRSAGPQAQLGGAEQHPQEGEQQVSFLEGGATVSGASASARRPSLTSSSMTGRRRVPVPAYPLEGGAAAETEAETESATSPPPRPSSRMASAVLSSLRPHFRSTSLSASGAGPMPPVPPPKGPASFLPALETETETETGTEKGEGEGEEYGEKDDVDDLGDARSEYNSTTRPSTSMSIRTRHKLRALSWLRGGGRRRDRLGGSHPPLPSAPSSASAAAAVAGPNLATASPVVAAPA